jgi:L-amino acid N-acyltransferase YncA
MFSIEPWQRFIPEAEPLFLEHMAELQHCVDVPLNLDMGRYARLYADGQLLFLTVRLDGALVGYFILKIAPHMRSKHTLIAQEEAIYLKPEVRGGMLGLKLLQMGVEVAKAAGVDMLFIQSQEGKPIRALLQRIGMKKTAEVYSMKFEKEPAHGE